MQGKHKHGAQGKARHKKAHDNQKIAGTFGILAGAACVLGYIMSLDPRGRHGAILAFLVAWLLFGLAIAASYWNPKNSPPRFSEQIDEVTIFVGSNESHFTNMAGGRSVPILKAGDHAVATAKLVNAALVVDAKLGASGVELKDNVLIKKPRGWDWQADDTTFEIVNDKGKPVFQLTYRNDNSALIRGIFFDETTKGGILVGEIDMYQIRPIRPTDVAKFEIKPIFKYPSSKYPKQRL